ncbi:PAS/PAC domain-containing protein [Yersinia enterocolitica]|nr:PAS/PAC domain-containing protein [Yersinia enterocolitica]CND66337.1 PAS/PAC domain-containing protein [Yersinia enterocolitica]CNG30434.1 PAS/PAC domain-containing protein [Yersinia enterocolitica]CNH98793.1 PAS/PAC domain-containing protein [Yersinia enterocolitica]CNI04097.1 PAS/PAC domain-containing protein [Yersinia enterocolitica]
MALHPASFDDHIFRLLIEAVDDYAIYIIDAQGHILTWNNGAERNTGYNADEIIGQSFELFYPPEDLATQLPAKGLLHANQLGHYENQGWRVRKNGKRFWGHITLSALHDSDHNLQGFVQITRDLTDKWLRENALRKSEELFRHLISEVEDYAIYMIDTHGRILTWNKGGERNEGYTSDEIIGEHFALLFTPEDISAGLPEKSLAKAIAEGNFQTEGWHVRKNGIRYWASVAINPMHDDSGKLLGFTKIVRDLTERRQREEALRISEERFRLMVDTVEDYAIVMLDPWGRVNTWNHGAERNMGYASNEIIGQHFGGFFLPEDIAAGLPEKLLKTSASASRVEREGWLVRKDMTRYWAVAIITVIHDNSGKLLGYAKIIRDMSERKQREDALRASEIARYEEREQLHRVLSSIQEGIISLDTEGRVVLMNPKAEEMTGRSQNESCGLPIEEVFILWSPLQDKNQLVAINQCLAEGRHTLLPEGSQLLSSQGERQEIRCSASPIRDRDNLLTGAVVVFQDVTRARHEQRELQYQANHDMLTGLINRRRLEERLNQAISQLGQDEQHILCYVDLDYFKDVNDSAGHEAGDMVLRMFE